MKQLVVIAAMLAAVVVNAQTKFESAMQRGMGMMKEAKSAVEMQEAAAFFERVAEAEKIQWLPYYYAAFSLYNAAWMDQKTDKDKTGEKCKELISKAEAIEKNADLYCLKQQIAVLQMMVDPMSRWQTYGQEGQQALAAAKQADPKNPRIYYLEAMTLMNTPEAFGGGKAVAKPLFAKSVELFKTYQPASALHPNWGKADAEKMLAQCQ